MRKILILLVAFISVAGFGHEKRNLLSGNYNRDQISRFCTDDFSWVKYPAYSDREAWEKIPEAKRKATIAAGEKYLGYDWPNILPTMYLEFSRTGNRNVIDTAIAQRLSALRALFFAELTEGRGRFLDDIINGVFTYCEQTYWGMSATFYLYEYGDSQSHPKTKLPDDSNPVIDLTVGDVASTLSWIWYFLHDEFDKVSPIVSQRLLKEMHRKVLEPYYTRNDFWWITGWNSGNVNNWTPWCSYNVLTSILLLETDPAKRLDGICKTMQSVDLFINSYPEDGGCNEGPSYWGHAVGMLYNYLSLLKSCSGGKVDIFKEKIITEMGRYIYKLYIGNGVNYVNFADAPAMISQDGIRIARYGQDIGEASLSSFGLFLAEKSGYSSSAVAGDVGQSLSNLFEAPEESGAKEILIADTYLPDLQVAVGRDRENSNEGFFFAAKGGHNEEQHNHNDVGSFVLYFNGKPVFIDPGVGTYTRETFSEDRYKIWSMQSGYHNLPIINGFMQLPGSRYKALDCSYKATGSQVSFSTDISKAYPEETGIERWVRSYTLKRGKDFTVKDSYSLKKKSGESVIVFMTPIPCKAENGHILLNGDGFSLRMSWPEAKLDVAIEEKPLEDKKLSNVWGDRLYRIVFSVKGNKAKDDLTFEICESKDFAEVSGDKALDKDAVAKVVNDAICWQKDNMPTVGRAIFNPRYTGWADGVFLSAIAEWTCVDDSRGLRTWLKNVAEEVNYEPAARTLNPANDLAVCMLYANLYEEDPKPCYLIDTIADYGRQLEVLRGGWKTIYPTIERLDNLMKYYPQMDDDLDFNLSRNQVRWCWCDALYMAAPTFAAFANITGNPDYREFMNNEFWRTVRALYDPEERLFFRDTRYKTIKSKNGEKMFWGRGNGWTVGAIARVLSQLPADYPDRPKYEKLLQEMMSRLVTLQDADGYWNTSLLDREYYPNRETSATGFFTYALWWGINNGVLDKDVYLPYAEKGWRAMVDAVHPNGMLGSVQAIGDAPENITSDKNEVYGTAALVLSGLEVFKYLKNK